MADATHRLALILEAKNEASKELQNVREDLGGVRDMASGMWQGLSSAIPGLGAIVGGAGIAGVVMGVTQLAKQAADLSKVGAAADRAGEAFERRLGGDATAALEKLRVASQGTISDIELMQSATRAQMLGVADDAETMAGLLEVAAKRGRDLGMSTADAFSDIVTGIGRLSPMILDNLGIVMDAKTTYETYAESVGKTAEALTDIEKRQALVNRVLQEATGDPGGLDAAAVIEAQAAAWDNLTTAAGEVLASTTALQRAQEDRLSVTQHLAEETAELADKGQAVSKMANDIDQRLSHLAETTDISAASLGLLKQYAMGMVDEFKRGDEPLQETRIRLEALFMQVERFVKETDDVSLRELFGDEEFRDGLVALLDPLEATRIGLDATAENAARLSGILVDTAGSIDMVTDAAYEAADAVAALSDAELKAAVRRGQAAGTGLIGGREPGDTGARRSQSAQDALALQMAADAEAERAARGHGSTMESLYREQQTALRSMAESILQPTAVTTADMFRAQTGALGGYVDKWDESARRLEDIANRGAASPWWEVLEIPEEVLAQGEEAVRLWARETADAVQRGVRPDLIDWEAFDRAAEEFMRDQQAREQTLAMAMQRLGGTAPESDVRAMLGMPADATQEAMAVGEAFQQGLGAVDMARAVTERFHEQMQAQMQRWVTMGSMTVTWFAQGLEEGVGDDTGLRIAKKLWPMIAPMIDNYLAQGVWN